MDPLKNSKRPVSKPETKSVIKIDEGCIETYPCQHRVSIGGVSQGEWDAVEIYEWFLSNGLPVPNHFQYVKKYLKDEQ